MARADPIELQLASIAHQLWCEKMRAEGWRPGPFDAQRRTHDALVDFEALGQVDQRGTVIGVQMNELLEQLRGLAEYPRGGDQEFSTKELRVGMRVTSSGEPDIMGTVESWEPDPDWPDALQTITVKWDTGERNEHVAAERELARQ